MDSLNKYSTFRLLLISLGGALFIAFPNIAWLPWELSFIEADKHWLYLIFFAIRFLFFCALIFLLVKINLQKYSTYPFGKRFLHNALISTVAYGCFFGILCLLYGRAAHFGSIVLFQFIVLCFLCTFAGHTYQLYIVQRKKEQEIERLKMENLQSRYDALMNQINPHFFFNSLNGLTALIRKKNDENTLTYVNKMSDVFRYILRSDRKGLATLQEELEFVKAFSYMLEVRFANKLEFKVEVDDGMLSSRLPVLSILPLIENVVAHNCIDNEHKMAVRIELNEQRELVVSNPVYPKLTPPETNGTGLRNLGNRFKLLMDREIRIEDRGDLFSVYLPLQDNV